jgi:hypothetical protein
LIKKKIINLIIVFGELFNKISNYLILKKMELLIKLNLSYYAFNMITVNGLFFIFFIIICNTISFSNILNCITSVFCAEAQSPEESISSDEDKNIQNQKIVNNEDKSYKENEITYRRILKWVGCTIVVVVVVVVLHNYGPVALAGLSNLFSSDSPGPKPGPTSTSTVFLKNGTSDSNLVTHDNSVIISHLNNSHSHDNSNLNVLKTSDSITFTHQGNSSNIDPKFSVFRNYSGSMELWYKDYGSKYTNMFCIEPDGSIEFVTGEELHDPQNSNLVRHSYPNNSHDHDHPNPVVTRNGRSITFTYPRFSHDHDHPEPLTSNSNESEEIPYDVYWDCLNNFSDNNNHDHYRRFIPLNGIVEDNFVRRDTRFIPDVGPPIPYFYRAQLQLLPTHSLSSLPGVHVESFIMPSHGYIVINPALNPTLSPDMSQLSEVNPQSLFYQRPFTMCYDAYADDRFIYNHSGLSPYSDFSGEGISLREFAQDVIEPDYHGIRVCLQFKGVEYDPRSMQAKLRIVNDLYVTSIHDNGNFVKLPEPILLSTHVQYITYSNEDWITAYANMSVGKFFIYDSLMDEGIIAEPDLNERTSRALATATRWLVEHRRALSYLGLDPRHLAIANSRINQMLVFLKNTEEIDKAISEQTNFDDDNDSEI